MKKLLFLFLFAALLHAGQTADYLVYVPSSATVVTTQNVSLKFGHFSNDTGSDVTIDIRDRSTNCNGGTCPVWKSVTVPANSTYHVEFRGVPASGGFTWQASTGNAVAGWITW